MTIVEEEQATQIKKEAKCEENLEKDFQFCIVLKEASQYKYIEFFTLGM